MSRVSTEIGLGNSILIKTPDGEIVLTAGGRTERGQEKLILTLPDHYKIEYLTPEDLAVRKKYNNFTVKGKDFGR